MVFLCLCALILNTVAAIVTGCAGYSYVISGDTAKATLEIVLCIANILLFISNCFNLKRNI